MQYDCTCTVFFVTIYICFPNPKKIKKKRSNNFAFDVDRQSFSVVCAITQNAKHPPDTFSQLFCFKAPAVNLKPNHKFVPPTKRLPSLVVEMGTICVPKYAGRLPPSIHKCLQMNAEEKCRKLCYTQ
jgi:hypothetical protein